MPSSISKYKILLVDDEPDILYLVAKALRGYGVFDVDEFSDPLKALDHFKNHAVDYSIVVSDVRMPFMNGIEFLGKVKLIRPEIPIVVMTAYEDLDNDILHQLPTMTKQKIVHKPFRLVRICNVVKEVLRITTTA